VGEGNDRGIKLSTTTSHLANMLHNTAQTLIHKDN